MATTPYSFGTRRSETSSKARDMSGESSILVTGASGFVGRALCRDLGSQARAAVRGPTDLQQMQVPISTLDGTTDWSAALAGRRAVVHLAAHVHQAGQVDNAAFRRVNLDATVNLARQAQAAGVRRFIFLSTAKVHGEGRAMPYDETDQPAPQGAYATSKAEAELALRALEPDGSMEICILRPPLVYGPGMKANILQLFRLVDSGVPLPLGALANSRSLISLANLVSAIRLALVHTAAAGQTFLVADDTPLSTPALIRHIGTALDRPARLLPVPASVLRILAGLGGRGDQIDKLIGNFSVDTQLIRRKLGWEPVQSLPQGLGEAAHWYRERQTEAASAKVIAR